MITADLLRTIAPAAGTAADLYAGPLQDTCDMFDISTDTRVAAFLAQLAEESGEFRYVVENLNYAAAALMACWPSLFDAAKAADYANQPERIANCAYAGRLGNGDEDSGDGWTYRGRGLIQITGKSNYQACGAAVGADLVDSPDLLEQPAMAAKSAGWFWSARGCNVPADAGNIIGITKLINGGTNGLAGRMTYWARAKSALGIPGSGAAS